MKNASPDHRSELRRELVAAAARRASEPQGPLLPSPVRRFGPLLLAAAVLLVVSAASVMFDSSPVAADAFGVTEMDGTVVVSVEGLIEDPEAAEEELRQAGLNASMVARPVPPSLVGAVVATTSEFGALDADSDGNRVTAFRIPRSETRPITIEYGRPALGGEAYAASEPVPDCADYVGRTLTARIRSEIADRYGPEIVWQEFGDVIRTEVRFDDLATGAAIVTVLPMSPDSVLVGVTDGSDAPPGVEC